MKAVLDASVAISWVHPEDVSVLIRGWLIRWTASGGAFVVPRHFWLEVVNSLAVKHRYRGAMVLEAIHELRHLPRSMG
jgi:predicted nucleic acid-binding protein